MKISYNLLKELIDFDWTAHELAERLTMSGSEVETFEEKGIGIRGIISARVTSVERLPGSDKLTLCKVYDGSNEIEVVCGAPNVAVGQIVLFAAVGSRIPGMTLEKTVIRGFESCGMVLSEAELELSDCEDEIAVLSSEIKPGVSLERIVDYKDFILELEITPNRPDCLSHIGIAREIQALGGGKLRHPDTSLTEIAEKASDAVRITIDDPAGCPRYTGRVLSDVTVAASPLWLKMIVFYLGMRPINNIVDITNYIMLETGHPLHAFDYDLFCKPEVVVRRAVDGEEFITLDEVSRKLNKEHLLITDGTEAVAIAGIMGGLKSEVSGGTTNILLESAYFNPVTIRRGSKALDLTTESSRRFERGADQNMAPVANDRACKLISEMAGGKILWGIVDAQPKPFVPVKIELRPSRVNHLLGADIPVGEIKRILEGLDMDVVDDGDIIIEQPSFRPDLLREVDLIEEIARIYGFDNIPSAFKPGGPLGVPETRMQMISEKVRSYLVGRGAMEIFPLTLTDSRMTERFGLSESSLKLINPLSEEMAIARPSMILSMLHVVKRNFSFNEKDLFLYELGNTYHPASDDNLPCQKTGLIIAMTGFETPVFWGWERRPVDLYSLKGIVENLADYLKVGPVKLSPAANFVFEKSRSFKVYLSENEVGYLGKLSDEGCLIADIKGDVYIAEISFDKVVELVPEDSAVEELARFPAADRDIAIIVDENVKSEDIRGEVMNSGGEIVNEVWVFDMYKGKNIPPGKKSLAYSIKFRLPDRTLTDDEVNGAYNRIIRTLEERFGAQLRSK